jgi:hypothetical protein
MDTILKKVKELNELVIAGRLEEGIQRFYHSDVVMQENESSPTIGQQANLERERNFLANIVEFRKAEVKGITAGEGVSAVIWHFDYTHKEWGVRNYTQVSVQHWQDGLIIKEQFFYGS